MSRHTDFLPSVRPGRQRRGRKAVLLASVAALAVTGCGGSEGTAEQAEGQSAAGQQEEHGGEQASKQRFPEIVKVEPGKEGRGSTYNFAVTISSPYDTPERYASGWRVLTPSGEQIAEHMLGHDHADEQPFTRSQRGVEVPEDVREVQIEPKDLKNGYGGKKVTVQLPS